MHSVSYMGKFVDESDPNANVTSVDPFPNPNQIAMFSTGDDGSGILVHSTNKLVMFRFVNKSRTFSILR